MSTVCSTDCSIASTRDTIVGASTNCSAFFGSRRTVRGKRGGNEIFGTAITWSGTKESTCESTATSWSTICGTGVSRIWSAPRCAADPGPVAPAAHPDTVDGNPSQAPRLRQKARSTRCLPSCVPMGRCAGPWTSADVRAIAIDCCSCRRAARIRCNFRRCAAPEARAAMGCPPRSILPQVTHKKALLGQTPVLLLLLSRHSGKRVYIHNS